MKIEQAILALCERKSEIETMNLDTEVKEKLVTALLFAEAQIKTRKVVKRYNERKGLKCQKTT